MRASTTVEAVGGRLDGRRREVGVLGTLTLVVIAVGAGMLVARSLRNGRAQSAGNHADSDADAQALPRKRTSALKKGATTKHEALRS